MDLIIGISGLFVIGEITRVGFPIMMTLGILSILF